MNYTVYTVQSLLAGLFALPACATGVFECEPTDRASWLTEALVSEKLVNEGWQVRRMKEDGGCWEGPLKASVSRSTCIPCQGRSC
jgi:hypothetical protein